MQLIRLNLKSCLQKNVLAKSKHQRGCLRDHNFWFLVIVNLNESRRKRFLAHEVDYPYLKFQSLVGFQLWLIEWYDHRFLSVCCGNQCSHRLSKSHVIVRAEQTPLLDIQLTITIILDVHNLYWEAVAECHWSKRVLQDDNGNWE